MKAIIFTHLFLFLFLQSCGNCQIDERVDVLEQELSYKKFTLIAGFPGTIDEKEYDCGAIIECEIEMIDAFDDKCKANIEKYDFAVFACRFNRNIDPKNILKIVIVDDSIKNLFQEKINNNEKLNLRKIGYKYWEFKN